MENGWTKRLAELENELKLNRRDRWNDLNMKENATVRTTNAITGQGLNRMSRNLTDGKKSGGGN